MDKAGCSEVEVRISTFGNGSSRLGKHSTYAQRTHSRGHLGMVATATTLLCLLGSGDGVLAGTSSGTEDLSETPHVDPALVERAHPQDALARVLSVRLPSAQTLRIDCVEPGNPFEQHVLRSPASTFHTLTVRGLKADTLYVCEATLPSKTRVASAVFRTDKLPGDLVPPLVTIPSTNLPQTAYTLFNYGKVETPAKLAWCAANYLVIMDAQGNVRWYYQGPGCGDVDASYIGSDQVLFTGRSTRRYPPTIVDLDKQLQFEATSALGSPYEIEGGYEHDAGLSVYRDSIFTLSETKPPEGGRGFVIKEIDLNVNAVVWSWDSTLDGTSKGQLRTDDIDASGDSFHPNAVTDRLENGKHYVYLSLWKTSQVHKIDYDTKAIVWSLGIDGDFTLLDAAGKPAADTLWFFNAHDAKFYSGNRIYLYDNGTNRTLEGGTHYSRALQLDLDPVAMTARIAFSYTEPDWAEPVWGGYDFLPESSNTLVAMGHCYEEDDDRYDICSGYDTNGHPSALVELNPQGTPVWRADFTSIQLTTYRAERIGGCEIFSNATYCPTLR